MGTLIEALSGIADTRTRKVCDIACARRVMLSLAAIIAGANDLLADHRFGRRLRPKGLEMLGIHRKRSPAHATLHYFFHALIAVCTAPCGLFARGDGLGHVAIDGKRLRGSQSQTSAGVYMLSAFATRLGATVGALSVPPDSNKMVETLALIRDLPIGVGMSLPAMPPSPMGRTLRRSGSKGRLLRVRQGEPTRTAS
jgi:hypothetical protein